MTFESPNNIVLYNSAEGYQQTMAFYTRMLDQITVPYTTKYIHTEAGLTHVTQAGPVNAHPVFLLHGMNVNAVSWVSQINVLAQQYCIYAADMPGCMGRSAPTRVERAGSAYGVWLSDVMDGLMVPQASFIGISFGGWLLVKLASVAAHKIASAILISAAGLVPQSNKLLLKMLPRLAIMPFVSLEQRARMFLDVMGIPGHEPGPEEIEAFGLLLSHFKYERRAPDPCTDMELACLTAPTALLYGEYEAAFNKEAAIKRAQRLLPNLVQCEIVAGVGHGMTGEDIPKVNRLLLDFLQRYSTSKALAS